MSPFIPQVSICAFIVVTWARVDVSILRETVRGTEHGELVRWGLKSGGSSLVRVNY